jgi:mono/diheme cytochrome c family protein
MRRLSAIGLGALFVASVGAFASAGGWAVVSVPKIPDAWIAGKPLQLQWQVRQHGITPLHGLQPTIEARAGSRRVTGRTWAFEEDGQRGYRGSIVFPAPGDWQVTIHSGFGRSKGTLIPWRVVDSVTPVRGFVEPHLAKMGVAPFPEVERGRRMFAALGCVTCHVHRAVDIAGEASAFGPDLSDRRFPPDYLARFLADPSIKPPTNGSRMPNLGLREKDIAPLVAFINAQPRVTSR